MEKDKRDIYALALEKYLTFLEKFGTDKEDIFMVIYSSDTDLIGGKNYKS